MNNVRSSIASISTPMRASMAHTLLQLKHLPTESIEECKLSQGGSQIDHESIQSSSHSQNSWSKDELLQPPNDQNDDELRCCCKKSKCLKL